MRQSPAGASRFALCSAASSAPARRMSPSRSPRFEVTARHPAHATARQVLPSAPCSAGDTNPLVPPAQPARTAQEWCTEARCVSHAVSDSSRAPRVGCSRTSRSWVRCRRRHVMRQTDLAESRAEHAYVAARSVRIPFARLTQNRTGNHRVSRTVSAGREDAIGEPLRSTAPGRRGDGSQPVPCVRNRCSHDSDSVDESVCRQTCVIGGCRSTACQAWQMPTGRTARSATPATHSPIGRSPATAASLTLPFAEVGSALQSRLCQTHR